MTDALKLKLEDVLKAKLVSVDELSGGDISKAYRVGLSHSKYFFVKSNSATLAFDMFKKERLGLTTLARKGTIKVPACQAVFTHEGTSVIILDYIESKSENQSDLKLFGKELAALHEPLKYSFGFSSDNYIGTLPQYNNKYQNWCQFYIEQRLEPQFKLAYNHRLLMKEDIPTTERLEVVLNATLSTERPSLLHGDLWSGNYLINKDGTPFLIDPAVYYGDKIIDIAMSQLFGGFGKAFYESYFYWTSQPKLLKERIELYQLYYLLVHLNLFGISYYPKVKRICRNYF